MFFKMILMQSIICVLFVIRLSYGISNNLSNENGGNFIPSSLASITNSGLSTKSSSPPKFASAKSSVDTQNMLITDSPTKQGKTFPGFGTNERDSIQTSSSHAYSSHHADGKNDGGYSPSSVGVTSTTGSHAEYDVHSAPVTVGHGTGIFESTGFGGDNYNHATYASVVGTAPTGHEFDGYKSYKTPVADYHFHEHHIKDDHHGHDHGYGGYHGGDFYGGHHDHDDHYGDHHGGHDVGHYGGHHGGHHDGHHGDHHGGHHAGFHESLLFGKALALKTLLIPLAGVALLGAAAAFVTNPVLLQLGVVTGKKKRKRRAIVNHIQSPLPSNTGLFESLLPSQQHKFTTVTDTEQLENVYPINDHVKPDRKYRHKFN